jgi:hypothetical protein
MLLPLALTQMSRTRKPSEIPALQGRFLVARNRKIFVK